MRLYVPDITASKDLAVLLSKEQANHVKVRRFERGEEIILFNEKNGDWIGVLETDKVVRLQRQVKAPQALRDIWLLQPLLAKERFAMVAEKATELGVAAFYPITTRFTQGASLNAERTAQHLIEASQQCERTSIPQLQNLQSLTSLLRAWDAARVLYVAMERDVAKPAAQVFETSSAAILVGPEGGFSDEEKELLQKHAAVKFFSLGDTILRSETAAIAALAIWQSVQT